MKLPKPKHPHGYTSDQVEGIIKNSGVTREQFYDAFGINTCMTDPVMGAIVYRCDIERALYKLGKKGGKFHMED